MNEEIKTQSQEVQITIPQGIPILYTDNCYITESQYGVVMDFAQALGPTTQQNVVARLGMSIEHAEALVKILSQRIVESKLKISNKKKENQQ